jgi:hypothetical protein
MCYTFRSIIGPQGIPIPPTSPAHIGIGIITKGHNSVANKRTPLSTKPSSTQHSTSNKEATLYDSRETNAALSQALLRFSTANKENALPLLYFRATSQQFSLRLISNPKNRHGDRY